MTRNRLVTCAALAAAAAFSAPAAAQASAGPGDDLAGAIAPPGGVLPLSTHATPHILGFQVNTAAYTTEAGEPLSCPISRTTYGKTVWASFRAPQYGRLDVTAAGFDSVLSLFDASARGAEVDCTDRLASKIESFPRDELPTVKKNHTYFVQVGGATQSDGSVPGGDLSVDLELIKPDTTFGDAVLTWTGTGKGVKINSLRYTVPSGAVLTVGCLKRSCGALRSFAVRKPVFRQRIAYVDVARRIAASPVPVERTFANQSVRAAAKPKLNGKRVKNGDTLIVAIQGPDQIGVIYYWRVSRGLAGAKNVGCIEPGNVKIKAVGRCTGQ